MDILQNERILNPIGLLECVVKTMNIANCNGDFECRSWNELKDFIRKSSLNPFDDIWISGEMDYPCLAILINGNYACVNYFLNGEGDMWQSIGYGNKNVAFVSNGERIYKF